MGPHLAAGLAGRARPESSQRPGAAAAAGATTRSPIAGSGVKDCTGGGFLLYGYGSIPIFIPFLGG